MTVEPNTPTPTLQQQIEHLQAAQADQLPATLRAALADQTEALIRSGVAARSLHVGDQAPDFTLPDALGRAVALHDLLGRGPAVLTFYRGEWCPYCNLALRAYQAILPEIEALGATLLAISPQMPDTSLTTVEKKGLTFPVLSDASNSVARSYGLVFTISEAVRQSYTQVGLDLAAYNGDRSGELPMPGTFVLAPDGTIRLACVDPDFTHRLEPAAILESLRALAPTGLRRESSH
jgi:peroxiredoxin